MQESFSQHYPSLEIQILGVNEDGHQSQNTLMAAEADLPWLQDLDTNGNGQSDVWHESWSVVYRDVQVVDKDGELVDTYNLTSNDLNLAVNFNALRDIFVTAAATPQESPWQSPIEPFDVNENGLVSPVDALIAVNALNRGESGSLSGTPGADDDFLDVTGDGNLTPLDPLRIINHLNKQSSSAQAALSSAAVVDDAPAASDVVFASYGNDTEDEDED